MKTNRTIVDGGVVKPVWKCNHCGTEFFGRHPFRHCLLVSRNYCSRGCRADALAGAGLS